MLGGFNVGAGKEEAKRDSDSMYEFHGSTSCVKSKCQMERSAFSTQRSALAFGHWDFGI
jgi:hypothetical protein